MTDKVDKVEAFLSRGDNLGARRALAALEDLDTDPTRLAALKHRLRLDPQVMVISILAVLMAALAAILTYTIE